MRDLICNSARTIINELLPIIFCLFKLFPIQNKVVASTMSGFRYADNPRYILEELEKSYPDIDKVWIKNGAANYSVPMGIRIVSRNNIIRCAYEYATAKIWIDSHLLRLHFRKRKGQFLIQTWHGGLGIKKVNFDIEEGISNELKQKIRHNCQMTDVFLSNSKFTTDLIRRSFKYEGDIFECGFPRNDSLFLSNDKSRAKIREDLCLSPKVKIALYAPTFRDDNFIKDIPDMTPYLLDYKLLKETLIKKWGGQWVILTKWHPLMVQYLKKDYLLGNDTTDVTEYQDMQSLIKASDVYITDYSSAIFDAGLCGIPSFTFALDKEKFCTQRGMYFDLEQLPFPTANSNEELIKRINDFDMYSYISSWKKFEKTVGLCETGQASSIIAKLVASIMKGNIETYANIK